MQGAAGLLGHEGGHLLPLPRLQLEHGERPQRAQVTQHRGGGRRADRADQPRLPPVEVLGETGQLDRAELVEVVQREQPGVAYGVGLGPQLVEHPGLAAAGRPDHEHRGLLRIGERDERQPHRVVRRPPLGLSHVDSPWTVRLIGRGVTRAAGWCH